MSAMRTFFVYILGGRTGTLYVGVTGDLAQRLALHRGGLGGAFTARYGVHRLLYVEQMSDVFEAISREKQMKGWSRRKKIRLVESINPSWRDLAPGWTEGPASR